MKYITIGIFSVTVLFLSIVTTVFAQEKPFNLQYSSEIGHEFNQDWRTAGNVSNSPVVELIINRSDLKRRPVNMRLSSDGNIEALPWQDYSDMTMFTFPKKHGEQPLHAQFQYADGEIVNVTQTFIIDTMPPDFTFSVMEDTIGPTINPTITGVLKSNDYWQGNYFNYRLSTSEDEYKDVWQMLNTDRPTTYIADWQPKPEDDGMKVTILFESRDRVNNVAPVLTDTVVVDMGKPTVTASVLPSQTHVSSIQLDARDARSKIASTKIRNKTINDDIYQSFPFNPSQVWQFGESGVAELKVVDAAGNESEPILVSLSNGDNQFKPLPSGFNPKDPDKDEPRYEFFQSTIATATATSKSANFPTLTEVTTSTASSSAQVISDIEIFTTTKETIAEESPIERFFSQLFESLLSYFR